MEIGLALVSALLFALGSVLQQKAGLDAPSAGSSSSLLLRMARRPVWLAGIGSDGLGFVTQAAALGIGRLAVVQPLLVTSVVFALPLGVIALIAFLTFANPSGGRSEAPLSDWLIVAIICTAVCVPLALLGRRGPEPRRAAMLGMATGVLFASTASLTKAVADELHTGILHVIGSWELYALVAVGYASMTFNQLALNTGALAATVASSGALDPIVSVMLGLTLFHESLHATPFEAVATIVALAAALVGMAVLARSEAHTPDRN